MPILSRLFRSVPISCCTLRRKPLPVVVCLLARTSSSFTGTTTTTKAAISFSAVAAIHTDSMPQPPHSYRSPPAVTVPFQLTDLSQQVSQNEAQRQEAYDLSRKIQAATVSARDALENSLPNEAETFASLQAFFQDSLFGSTRKQREANLSSRVEDYLRLAAFRHFLQTSALLGPEDNVAQFATDEEYLAGAVMGLAQDLQRYGLGRATVRDAESVRAAATLVSNMMDFLLQLDFRNGPLRRKYDGTKYSLRALETLLYELAVTGTSPMEGSTETPKNGPDLKKLKLESTLLPNEDLKALKLRMEQRDELRESLIKKCRDGQKAAKQSIFALHRGDVKRAMDLMSQCERCVTTDLLPIVQQEPALRAAGSFMGVLEEYAEARLFASWLESSDTQGGAQPSGKILQPTDFTVVELRPEEYLGGLCDLTGEVGRYAVQRGTARDVEGVQLCLQTNASILSALQTMERLPGAIFKKIDTVRRSVEKLERMLYEMSLSEAAGGRLVHTDVEIKADDNEA